MRRREEEISPQISQEQKKEIIKALEARGANRNCPMCGNKNFAILDGYFQHSLQSTLAGMVIGGPSIPCAVVACTNCGYLSQHALGALGLLPEEEVRRK